ncbi:MAG: FAD:protein FMN transferase [Clostridia bacterium]|nr:FAD:protein FMN transferase [Clostridia bacterium]
MKPIALLALVLLRLPLFGCRTETPHSMSGFACDTIVTVTAYAPQETVDATLAICADYEKVLSKTAEGSDVWRLNHANGEPVVVDPETAALLSLAVEIGTLSDGAFDVTIAPASALWDFNADEPVLPDPDALRTACERIDYRNIVIDGNTVTLLNGAEIDLGGIAKGYIADRVAAYLRSQGVASACINLGGNVVTIGTKPNGDPWTIGIRDPNGAPDESEEVVSITDGAIVTSGTYERGFTLDGVRYHHVLDPETGMPVSNGLASVTIIGERSDLCDALSTACFVLGEEASKPLLDRFGVSAIFLYADGARSAYPGS